MKIYVYFKNGNVDIYQVESEWKAREHAEKIMIYGYRMRVGSRMEWFGPHWIDKICWEAPNEDYLSGKYESPNQRYDKEVKLEPENTPIGKFQKERTDAISEMFENVDEYGIYPTGKFFTRLDNCVKELLKEKN